MHEQHTTYIAYLHEWASTHSDYKFFGSSPQGFHEWLDNEILIDEEIEEVTESQKKQWDEYIMFVKEWTNSHSDAPSLRFRRIGPPCFGEWIANEQSAKQHGIDPDDILNCFKIYRFM